MEPHPWTCRTALWRHARGRLLVSIASGEHAASREQACGGGGILGGRRSHLGDALCAVDIAVLFHKERPLVIFRDHLFSTQRRVGIGTNR